MDRSFKIAVIGAGVMGQALIKGMLDSGWIQPDQITACVGTTRSREKVAQEYGVEVHVGYPIDQITTTDLFLICTKPYRTMDALAPIVAANAFKKGAFAISIAAGLKLANFKDAAPDLPIIRAMPNTPSLIRRGVTVLSPSEEIDEGQIAIANRIFSSVGMCIELPESNLDAVTAVSGAGPAYAFLMMEALADGAVQVGLPRDVAFMLVAETMRGAAEMMMTTGKHPAMLKDEVTTPAGCTISALLTMEDGKIRSTLARAVEAATRKAGELG